MTHLTGDLNRLCRMWCPIIGQCPMDAYCNDMEEIKRRIISIAGYEYKEEKDE